MNLTFIFVVNYTKRNILNHTSLSIINCNKYENAKIFQKMKVLMCEKMLKSYIYER